jgi:DNA-directed RNA polymerase subunit M/transcription elongation factor TFIIS
MVEFCPKCGSFLLPKKRDKRIALVCPECDFSEENPTKVALGGYRESNKIPDDLHVQPISHVFSAGLKGMSASIISGWECRKCHGNEAYTYSKQTRSGDEGMTQFVVCANCGREERLSS